MKINDFSGKSVGIFTAYTIQMLLEAMPMFAAAGWALLYLLFGGGLGGAVLIFIILKMFGK